MEMRCSVQLHSVARLAVESLVFVTIELKGRRPACIVPLPIKRRAKV